MIAYSKPGQSEAPARVCAASNSAHGTRAGAVLWPGLGLPVFSYRFSLMQYSQPSPLPITIVPSLAIAGVA